MEEVGEERARSLPYKLVNKIKIDLFALKLITFIKFFAIYYLFIRDLFSYCFLTLSIKSFNSLSEVIGSVAPFMSL